MRTLTSACAVTVAAAASMLLGPAAYATTPGDNGTVKIHDATTDEELVKNEPHVCEFYLDAFKFDANQQVTWSIVEMPPTGTKGQQAARGTLDLDASGHGRTDDMKLPDGHYKLIWNFDGENGQAKHKVFWSECEDNGGTSGGNTGGSSGENTGGSSGGNTGGTSGDQGTSGETGKSANGSEENLAETGASVVGASVTAAALLGAGGWLMLRRRASGRS